MSDTAVSPELLEPALPGAWIAEHLRIWQMNFLKAYDLARFCSDRGLSDFGEKGIARLWQLGLLKADRIESEEEFPLAGLVDRGIDRYGRHIYSDERQLLQRPEGWGDALKTLNPLLDDVKLLFHPFRYYVIYHLNRVFGIHISKMQMFDPNRWIHTLLCLGKSELRLELEGHLGGALLLRTMAEMLRRATQEAFETTLREEDELGTGQVPESFKETLYGSSRLLDNSQAASVFVRRYGLNYKAHVHLYVEGTTEYGALNHFKKMMGIFVPINNLHGLMKSSEGNQMLTFFWDELQADIKNQVYSLVMIDEDLEENVKPVRGAARLNQTSENEGMFGRFFLANPDFELANFEIEELEEILWKWVAEYTETSPSQTERELLHSYVKDATGSKGFFDGVGHATRFLLQLTGYEKGAEWGAKLMDYAWEHPLKRSRKRQLREAVELVIRWEKTINMERYEVSKKSYMVDTQTGEPVKRSNAE